MAPMVSSIEIARPPDEVFAYVTDPSRFGDWQRDVVAVRQEDGRPGRAGSRFTTTRRIGGTERSMTQEVTEAAAPRRWAARAVDGPVRPNATVTVEPLADGAGSGSPSPSTSRATASAGRCCPWSAGRPGRRPR